MKKIFDVLALLLAINFLAVAGGVGWLYQSGHLDHERVQAVKAILFPPPVAETPATQPSAGDGAPSASQRLADLLARKSNGMASEKLESVQQAFDVAFAQLDRRERETADREREVARANAKLAADRKTLEEDRQRLTEDAKKTDALAADKGFQDTLALYNSMPSKQVKGMFMTMDEKGAAEYLDAMTPRTAAKILKEFKTQGETDRVKRILENMRHPPGQAGATTQDSKDNPDAASR